MYCSPENQNSIPNICIRKLKTQKVQFQENLIPLASSNTCTHVYISLHKYTHYHLLKIKQSQVVIVVYDFNPVILRHRQEDLYEFEAALVYRVSSSRTARNIYRDPISKNNKQKKRNTNVQ